MQIHVENLHRSFGKTKAVNDLSFSFGTGQVFAFVGPNGAGKTTTMRILATLDVPDEGHCRFDDLDILQYPEKARRMIGYMPDNLPTHRDLSVHDYLDFFARAYGLRGKKRLQMVDQIESFTNLTGIREKPLKALSKGMKQRVSLARALIHDPELLIMDEPAAGLDPRARVELRELLSALADAGKAIFISSHILTELAEIASGAVIIEKGALVTHGSLAEISRHGRAVDDHFQHVAIRTKDNNDGLYKAMLEMPHVRQAKQAGPFVEAEVAGDEDQACELLAELLRRNFRVIEFKQVETDLEQVFMNVTKGDVQ
ncbi:MAG: ABC transporter ATP-binding protein [Planctomycetota bacterium]